MSNADERRRIYEICARFILENKISSPEAIYQMDNVNLNSFEFIEEICDVIGYADITYDDEGDEVEE